MFPASVLLALHKWYERQFCWAVVQPLYAVSQPDSVASAVLVTFDPVHVAPKRTQNWGGVNAALPV
jgi:hypothetical protein